MSEGLDVALGNIFWRSHCVEGAKTERADGYLSDGINQIAQLDVSCFGDDCCAKDDPEAVKAAWADGGVFVAPAEPNHGVPTLVVPLDILTPSDIIEALRRFQP